MSSKLLRFHQMNRHTSPSSLSRRLGLAPLWINVVGALLIWTFSGRPGHSGRWLAATRRIASDTGRGTKGGRLPTIGPAIKGTQSVRAAGTTISCATCSKSPNRQRLCACPAGSVLNLLIASPRTRIRPGSAPATPRTSSASKAWATSSRSDRNEPHGAHSLSRPDSSAAR